MPTILDAWTSVTPSPRNKLVEKVVRLYGMDSTNSNLNQLALDALDESVNDMNCAAFEFNRVAESGITMEVGTQHYLLTTQFFKESQAYLVDNDGGDVQPMTYLPWVHFKRLYPDETSLGHPTIYTIFNFEQDGRVYLYPTPNDDTVAEFTFAIEYYRRIPLVSSLGESNSLAVPREVESALVFGAQKRVAIHVVGAGHPDVAALATLEAQALERLKRVDKLHPDERIRFRLVDHISPGMRGEPGFFIKV